MHKYIYITNITEYNIKLKKKVYSLFAQISDWLILAEVDERFQGCTDFIVRSCEWSGRVT